MAYQSINPLNGELLQKFDQHTDAQMESALAKADSTFQHVWSKATFRDRAKVVGKAASLMLERKEQSGSPCRHRNGEEDLGRPR